MALKWTRGLWPVPPWLIVAVDGVDYAVDGRRIRHLTPGPVDQPGEIVFDGVSYPPVDLRELFGLPPAAPGHGRVVLVEDGGGRRAALYVDAVRDLARLDGGDCTPLPWVYAGRERRWFQGLATSEGRLVLLLSLDGLLGAVPEPAAAEA